MIDHAKAARVFPALVASRQSLVARLGSLLPVRCSRLCCPRGCWLGFYWKHRIFRSGARWNGRRYAYGPNTKETELVICMIPTVLIRFQWRKELAAEHAENTENQGPLTKDK
jgi:hypothetical protein